MTEQLGTLTVALHDNTCVATLSGEIDLSNREVVTRQLHDAVDEEGRDLVVDLNELSYLDSSGIRMLFDLQDRLAARRQLLRLVATPDLVVWRLLTLTGLTDTVPHHPTVGEALAASAGSTGGSGGRR